MSYGSQDEVRVQDRTAADSISLLKRTKNNVKGWYFYSFSSEPFAVSAVAIYIPLLLEQFARTNGVTVGDHSKKCTSNQDKCVLGLFSNRIYIDTSSFALYTFSVSVLLQILVVITVSGLVDVWRTVTFKRRILMVFGALGAFAVILISQLSLNQYYMLAALYIVANTCYGVVNVVGNSLLPRFVSDLVEYEQGSEPLSADILTTVISGKGASLGYGGSLLVQIFSMWLVNESKTQDNIQVAVLFVGIWWICWQSPMMWLLQDVKPAFFLNDHSSTNYPVRFEFRLLKCGWFSLLESLKNAKLLKDMVIFLLGWFIVSDSLTTINSAAILFARTELGMSTLSLILISVLTMISAILGAFFIPHYICPRFQLTPQRTLIYIICWSSVIPFYGLLGFAFENIGLKHPAEMFVMSVWYGISIGGVAAVSRSLFSLIIPPGRESTFFSLFSVTDKGSSIVGPMLVGFITDETHEIRYSFYLLFALLVVSIPIFNSINLSRAKKGADELRRVDPEALD
ncbi:ATG22 (YCL038C) [Zygosaccharomyces parabailii]|nr:ATG22 (YCL038C) [Zygosaccharomyces parabailii]CDH09816.1 probable Autophagy-related protein 22 [Zygosaccharomyces bailii ISA1307]